MPKCVNCRKGIVETDHVNKTTIYSCKKCHYIDSVAFQDGTVFEGEFKDGLKHGKFRITGDICDIHD